MIFFMSKDRKQEAITNKTLSKERERKKTKNNEEEKKDISIKRRKPNMPSLRSKPAKKKEIEELDSQ